MENFNKDDLIAKYQASKAEDGIKVTDREARSDTDHFLSSLISLFADVKDEVPNSKGVRARLTLVNFGSFELKHTKERAYKNPQDKTAKPVIKPAHNKVTLGLGKVFEEAIN